MSQNKWFVAEQKLGWRTTNVLCDKPYWSFLIASTNTSINTDKNKSKIRIKIRL